MFFHFRSGDRKFSSERKVRQGGRTLRLAHLKNRTRSSHLPANPLAVLRPRQESSPPPGIMPALSRADRRIVECCANNPTGRLNRPHDRSARPEPFPSSPVLETAHDGRGMPGAPPPSAPPAHSHQKIAGN